jgi:tRNA pseudouridine55 synthase
LEALILNPGSAPLSRNIEDYPDGIIIPIDKPYRWTSADVIRKVKYAAIRHFGKKNLKVGHAGTLDPLATGILLVCIGKATKLAETLQSHDKEYIAGITFGATTPSYDLEKEIDRMFPYEHITAESILEVLPAFIGEQDQVAPLFSAKSVDGVRAYELARKLHKEGKTLDEAAQELIRTARINITELELLEFNAAGSGCGLKNRVYQTTITSASSRINITDNSALGLPHASIRMACSKGTYVRAFARDLGEALGSGAHLDSLQRSRSGIFKVEEALSVEQTLEKLAH